MGVSTISSLLIFLFLFSLFQTPAFAENKAYIVHLGSHPDPSNNIAATYDHALKSHLDLLASCLGSYKKAKSAMFYSYNRFINGFAATLSEQDVTKVKNHPKVISVFENRAMKMQTTNSWKFLGLENDIDIPLNSAWKKARFGEDVIIGNLDSGVVSDSKSFSDEGMSPIPKRWRGTCQTNKRDGIKCNRKLIGVRFFNKGYLRYARRLARRQNKTYTCNPRITTAYDFDGHGIHTLSTAGGNFVANVSYHGQGKGTAKGGAPKARVAAYKVCWDPFDDGKSCLVADMLAGIEAAISDGVDVLSVSIAGYMVEFFEDGFSLGAFHAVRHGITVIFSGGNSGPDPGTVINVPPWVLTVGASTTNRKFINYVTLGNKQVLKGLSISTTNLAHQKSYPLILGENASINEKSKQNATMCIPEALNLEKVKGSILVCLCTATNQPTSASAFFNESGAVGLIAVNDKTYDDYDVQDEKQILPTSHINHADGQSLFAYVNSTDTPVAQISDVQTEFDKNSVPVIPPFSSRGPNKLDEAILKPDVIAPGVNIIAGSSTEPYAPNSGTSMACPHVAGIAGLIKAVHPDWSPAAIKSAIMTTANARFGNSNILDFNKVESTPLDYGTGLVNPNNALDPGLVYDLNIENYLNYLCARGYNDAILRAFTISDKPYSCPQAFNIGDFNYPAIVVPKVNGSWIKYSRHLKNVGSPGTYNVTVKAPTGVNISIEPTSLKFMKYGEEKKFEINFTPNKGDVSKGYKFGELIWSDGYHNVRSPIVVIL